MAPILRRQRGQEFRSPQRLKTCRFADCDSRYWLDSSAIKRDVGWEPQITWQEGMREMVEWGRKYLPQLKTLPTDFVMRA